MLTTNPYVCTNGCHEAMLMTEKQVNTSLDQHPIKTVFSVSNKSGPTLKNLHQLNGDSTTNSTLQYSTLSLGRKGKRGISQLIGEDDSIQPSDEKIADGKKEPLTCFTVETPEYTLILPDINTYSPDFRDFLKRDLLETSTLVSLEHAGRLNWWVDLGICRRLFPLVTTGDGNCLLHAASLALNGVHDNRLILRRKLGKMMCGSPFKNAFFRRWRWHQTMLNKQSELVFTEEEWMEEWNNLAKLASTQPRIPSQPPYEGSTCLNGKQRPCEDCDDMEEILYESLEEFHVFILAHVLKRTIIIIADTILKNLNGEPLAPISFGGIYLPLECSSSECHKSPLLLTYDAAHFSALVPMEDDSDTTKLADAIPLVDPDFELLPVHFAYDPGFTFQWSSLDDNYNVGIHQQNEHDLFKLLQSYMDVKFLSVPYAGEFDQKPDKKDIDKDQTQKTCRHKSYDCPQSCGAVLNFSDSTGNSSRTCSSQSSPEENSIESSKSDADCSKNQGSSVKSSSKGKKFSSIKKRISKTLKMGLCASGIQQEADEVDEKKVEHANGSRNFFKKTKSMEEGKDIKTISPGNNKGGKIDESVDPNFMPSNLATKEINSCAEIKVNSENGKQQFVKMATPKRDAQPLTQLKCPDGVLCARLYHKREEPQDQILKKYFIVAQERFQQFKKEDRRENQNSLPSNCHLDPHQTSAGSSQSMSFPSSTSKSTTMHCINSGCMGFDACAETSYLCRECFERQKQEELDLTLKMTSNKQMQSQSHQTKYSPSSSSSTIHLPLIKNANPVNSHFQGYKSNLPFQIQQNPSSINFHQKTSQTFQPIKSHVITSSTGAAAFNKSFESSFKENCIVSPSGGSFVGPTCVVNRNGENIGKYTTGGTSGMAVYSPMNTKESSKESTYAQSIKQVQVIDSSLYASEEEDDDDDDVDGDGKGGALDEKSKGTKLVSQSKINSHDGSACIFGRSNPKLAEPVANNKNIGFTWDNGFRSSSFDDNNCHSRATTAVPGVGPWVSKTTFCKTEGCSFYGTANSDYFCSRCYKQKFGECELPLGIPANKSIVL